MAEVLNAPPGGAPARSWAFLEGRVNPAPTRCTYVDAADGLRCVAPVDKGRELCFWHARLVKERARVATMATLPDTVEPPELDSPEGIRRTLTVTADRVQKGALAPALAQVVIRACEVSVSLATLELQA